MQLIKIKSNTTKYYNIFSSSVEFLNAMIVCTSRTCLKTNCVEFILIATECISYCIDLAIVSQYAGCVLHQRSKKKLDGFISLHFKNPTANHTMSSMNVKFHGRKFSENTMNIKVDKLDGTLFMSTGECETKTLIFTHLKWLIKLPVKYLITSLKGPLSRHSCYNACQHTGDDTYKISQWQYLYRLY